MSRYEKKALTPDYIKMYSEELYNVEFSVLEKISSIAMKGRSDTDLLNVPAIAGYAAIEMINTLRKSATKGSQANEWNLWKECSAMFNSEAPEKAVNSGDLATTYNLLSHPNELASIYAKNFQRMLELNLAHAVEMGRRILKYLTDNVRGLLSKLLFEFYVYEIGTGLENPSDMGSLFSLVSLIQHQEFSEFALTQNNLGVMADMLEEAGVPPIHLKHMREPGEYYWLPEMLLVVALNERAILEGKADL